MGERLGHRSGDDHRRRVRRAAARRGRAAPFARGDGRRVDGRLSPPLRAGARPAAPVHRDAPARVRGRSARRPHASRRRHRADVDAQRPLARRRGVRRRGGLARLPAPGLRHVEADRRAPGRESVRPRRPARAPRPRHVGQHVRGGLQEHHRVRHESCRGGGQGRSRPVRSGRQGERGARGERVPRPPGADASCAPRLAPRRCGRRRARGRPEPRGGRIRLVGTSLRGEPGRRAVPRPPDQHETQAARGRVRPGERRPRRPRRRPATRCRRVRRVVPRVLREARRRRDPAVPAWIPSARGSS